MYNTNIVQDTENPIIFDCQGERLIGILHAPENPRARGVLIVVGGPQYRVGSHRQFLLLARDLAARGYPVLRFDYRGMGDSDGADVTFEQIADDIRAATDVLFERIEGLKDVAIWGLCDAASAAMMDAYSDARVTGLVLANPWARTEESIAKTYMQHYYRGRLFDPALWRRLFSGDVKILPRLREFWTTYRQARTTGDEKNTTAGTAGGEAHNASSFIERMRRGFGEFGGQVLLIMSGEDLVAAEFGDCVSASPDWQKLCARATTRRHDLAPANHTFSRREWRDQVTDWTCEWLESW